MIYKIYSVDWSSNFDDQFEKHYSKTMRDFNISSKVEKGEFYNLRSLTLNSLEDLQKLLITIRQDFIDNCLSKDSNLDQEDYKNYLPTLILESNNIICIYDGNIE